MAMSYTRGYGPKEVIKTLYAKKHILDETMNAIAQKSAEEIKDLSVALSPVDEGHLEEAHRVVQRMTRSDNFAYDVEVDPTVADLGEYLDFIHNNMNYKLGPLSLAKADATGMDVGPQFMERAFTRLKPQILTQYRMAVKEFTR